MRATAIYGAGDIRVVELPDPRICDPHDAIVTVTHACICGSDLWAYRGVARRAVGQPIGHEFVGVVAEVGSAVRSLRPGTTVLAPFAWSDGVCAQCIAGWPTSCPQGGFWGRTPGAGGAQAEQVRVPYADGTLVPVPQTGDDRLAAALLTLSDVLCTGHHAAVSAGVTAGMTVAVIGDGAVGLCAVLAAARLGAARIVLVAHHRRRVALARRFGAADVIVGGGEANPAGEADAVARHARELIGGDGADATLECVGTETALRTAVALARAGSTVGMVGVPHEVEKVPIGAMFGRNIALRAGVAPARRYIPELLPDVLSSALDPTPVFDLVLPLDQIAHGYAAMAARRAVKVLIRP